MKIFIGYGFTSTRDDWIPKLIFPLIKAFGDDVVTGEDLQGDRISDAVREKIGESEAIIGFLTRREDSIGAGKWQTHRWVIDELAAALAKGCHVLEVREDGVDEQGGMMGDRQRIAYKENLRDQCIVDIAKAIGKWHQRRAISLRLLPEECVRELMPLHRKQDLRCTYTLLLDRNETAEAQARLVPITGGLFLNVKDVPQQALVQIHVEYQGKHWRSSYENIDSPGIHLLKE